MGTTHYFKAKDHKDRVVSGRVVAGSVEEVRNKLMSKQLVLISSSTERPATSLVLSGGVSQDALVIGTRQLAFLVGASVPIVEALHTVSNNTKDIGLKKVMRDLSGIVESGQPLSSALKRYPSIFSVIYVNLVRSGEEGGSLDVMLKQLATYIEKTHSIKKRVKAGMMYPGFVTIAATAIVIGIMMFLVPKFQDIFSDSGKELPMLTQTVIAISTLMRENFIMMTLGVIVMGIGVVIFAKHPVGARVFESIQLKLPGFGSLFIRFYIARFARTTSSLLSSGGTFTDAITLGGKASGSIFFREATDRIARMVESGYSFSNAISKETVFPGIVRNMVSVGEKTGNVDDVLNKIAEFYEEQVESTVEGLLKLIEPVLIVGIALVIGFIVISLYLPVFEMGSILSEG